MQASTNTQAPSGRRSRRGSRVVLALLAALVVSVFALLESERPTQAIVGGSKATANPDMAALFYQPRDGTDPFYFCTGTLIDKDSVLTAAHCFHDLIARGVNNEDVKRGAFNVTVGATKLGEGQGVVRDAEAIWIHHGYDLKQDPDHVTDPSYDAAVLTLNQPVTGPNIRPAEIATAADDRYEKKGQVAYLAGWGRTCTWCAESKHLRWVSVKIKDDQDVGKSVGRFTFYPDRMVAAKGAAGSGGCSGDSGGPLWVEDKGHQPVIGIYSFGGQWCDLGNPNPDVFTEVNNRSVRTFIVDAMRASGVQGIYRL